MATHQLESFWCSQAVNYTARIERPMSELVLFCHVGEARNQTFVTMREFKFSSPMNNYVSPRRKTAMHVHRQASPP